MAPSSSFFVRLVAGTSFFCASLTHVPLVSSEGVASTFQELSNIHEQDVADFLDQQAQDRSFERALEGSQEFGQRCGNNNQCVQDMDCTEVNMGNRCLPNTCLEETMSETFKERLDIDSHKEMLFDVAGYSEEDIFAALAEAKNAEAFLEINEWIALQRAFDANLEPLIEVLETGNECIAPRQDNFFNYIGLHIEVS